MKPLRKSLLLGLLVAVGLGSAVVGVAGASPQVGSAAALPSGGVTCEIVERKTRNDSLQDGDVRIPTIIGAARVECATGAGRAAKVDSIVMNLYIMEQNRSGKFVDVPGTAFAGKTCDRTSHCDKSVRARRAADKRYCLEVRAEYRVEPIHGGQNPPPKKISRVC